MTTACFIPNLTSIGQELYEHMGFRVVYCTGSLKSGTGTVSAPRTFIVIIPVNRDCSDKPATADDISFVSHGAITNITKISEDPITSSVVSRILRDLMRSYPIGTALAIVKTLLRTGEKLREMHELC